MTRTMEKRIGDLTCYVENGVLCIEHEKWGRVSRVVIHSKQVPEVKRRLDLCQGELKQRNRTSLD